MKSSYAGFKPWGPPESQIALPTVVVIDLPELREAQQEIMNKLGLVIVLNEWLETLTHQLAEQLPDDPLDVYRYAADYINGHGVAMSDDRVFYPPITKMGEALREQFVQLGMYRGGVLAYEFWCWRPGGAAFMRIDHMSQKLQRQFRLEQP